MPAARMTADEFLALPKPVSGFPWNLIDGEVVVADAPMVHGDAVDVIHSALRAWALDMAGRGRVPWPCDVEIDERNVYRPDVLWYRDGRVPRSTQPPPYPLPDLAVEVGSLSNPSFDAGPKRENYEAAGLPELWLVDAADGGVFVHRRSSEQERAFDILETLSERDVITSPLLPEFSLSVGEVFRSPA